MIGTLRKVLNDMDTTMPYIIDYPIRLWLRLFSTE